MTTQMVTLTKSQVVAAIQAAALAQAGIDPATTGLVVAVRILNELDVPATASYPRAAVNITTP